MSWISSSSQLVHRVNRGLTDPTDFFKQRKPKCYFPTAAAGGSPPISPAFSSYWNVTTSAARVAGRFRTKYNSGPEDVAFAATNSRRLFRQYVIPFKDLGVAMIPGFASLQPGTDLVEDPAASGIFYNTNFYALGFVYESGGILAKTTDILSGTQNFLSAVRVVNGSGSDITASTATRQITASYTAGSLTMTSSGLFIPADIGCSVCPMTNSHPPVVNDFSNTIVDYISSSSVILGSPYTASRTGNIRIGTKGSVTTADTVSGIGWPILNNTFTDVYFPSNVGGGLNTSFISDDWYLVIELGTGPSATAATNTLRFRDTTDETIPENLDATKSTGAIFRYAVETPTIG